jgi:hypothetical protein
VEQRRFVSEHPVKRSLSGELFREGIRPSGKGVRMRKLIFIFLALALALSACAPANQSEVERNRQKWQNANLSHYRFNLFVGCFCVFTEDMPLAIEVKDGDIVSMAYHNGKEIDPSLRELFEKYGTIDRIFAELEKDLNGEADKVDIKYDATHGFPSEVFIDFMQNAADDELSLTVSNLEKLP